MTYIIINDQAYQTDTTQQILVARAAMAQADVDRADVWTCSYDTVEAAEDAGFEGAYRNGECVFV